MNSNKKKYFIAGSTGLAGSAICRKLDDLQESYFGASTKDVDFKKYKETFNIIKKYNPDTIIIAAAKVGGIKANNDYPVEFFNENILIGTNIINAAFELKIPNLIFLGSSCIYPKFAQQPISENLLLSGKLEDTNKAYAIAKIACIELIRFYRKQHNVNWFSVNPPNLYGKNDNFNLETSHALPAILRKIHEAKINNLPSVTLWGNGSAKREFLSSDDLADALIFLCNKDNIYDLINVGVGYDITIKELSELIKKIVGYNGDILWNNDGLDGTPKKLVDNKKIIDMGWKPTISLDDGISNLYEWYINK